MLTNEQTHDITMLAKGGALDMAYKWLLEQRKVMENGHKVLTALKLKMHPDKTYLGCIKKGFDFLGVHFGETPEISEVSRSNHQTRLAQRYARNESLSSIGRYRARWTSWCNGLLKCCMDCSTHRSGDKSNLAERRKGLLRGNNHENTGNTHSTTSDDWLDASGKRVHSGL